MAERWPTFVLAAAVCLLGVPLAKGSPEVRIGAGISLVSLAVGLWLVAGRLRRVDHGDDEHPPSRTSLALQLADSASKSIVSVASLVAFLFLAVVAPGAGPGAAAGWVGPVMAGAASLAVCGGLASARHWSLRAEGFERDVFLRSTSTAFFTTMVACVSYALFETLADAPPVPAWAPWTVGIVTWLTTSAWYTRRAS